MSRSKEIISFCEKAMANRLHGKHSVSEYTKNAKMICRTWQEKSKERYANLEIEKKVAELGEKYDIYDPTDRIAYELKVSGKNADKEFFKDVMKLYADDSLKSLVFITEAATGRAYIEKALVRKVVERARSDGFDVCIEYVCSCHW